MTEILYKNAVEILLNRFPEFLQSEHCDEQELSAPYVVWGGFGAFVTSYIQSMPKERLDSDPFVVRVFEFANELMSNADAEVQNLVVIELFENFYCHRKTLDLARREILTEHLHWLEKQGEWLSTNDEG